MSQALNLGAFMPLAEAARIVGIAPATAAKLPPEEFVPVFWLGDRRMVPRRRFEAWLQEKTRLETR